METFALSAPLQDNETGVARIRINGRSEPKRLGTLLGLV